ncbi:MAG: restriction endonuclease [Ignavibacteriales bacterium CG18_big_fil_WC_8_21_14_2_50_31_20]|nr:MAG: restriction endonuclease [Ignavibacteriales bacterium CG18_big_fil_WC_8_21_14_2_50_31_20]
MSRKIITTYEHSILKVGNTYSEIKFEEKHQRALEIFYGEKGLPFFKLINNGIRLTEFVGVLQVGNLIIEVLPKADKNDDEIKFDNWRKTLIGMLRAVGAFNIHAPSSSSLSVKSNFLLDLYFELFIKEVEYLFNKGLIRKYRRTEGNSFALKGNILFGKHLQKNVTHQERFYIKQTTYDKEHLLHQILYKTLLLLKVINTNVVLSSRIENLLLNFPEMNEIKVTEITFNDLVLNRKTEEYKNSIEIAKLLLLNYHPDLSSGQNNVLALMFDMNFLWEKFIYVSLRKKLEDEYTVIKQISKYFWKPNNGSRSSIIPDILIENISTNSKYVIDTKWKNLSGNNPSLEDLRQMYVYHKYFSANKVALVYPGKDGNISGKYYKKDGKEESNKVCSVISIDSQSEILQWQNAIKKQIEGWITSN